MTHSRTNAGKAKQPITRKRAAVPESLPVFSNPCHKCGNNSPDAVVLDSCRTCGASLGKSRFTYDGLGAAENGYLLGPQ